mgnify:CR=1 FL=1
MARIDDSQRTYYGFLWHAIFFSITVTFTEVNTVLPALILDLGGSSYHIGIISAIMIGIPLITKLMFTSFLSKQERKQPYLLLGINLRVISLLLIAMTLIYQTRLSFTTVILLIYGELFLFSISGAFAGLPYIHIVGGTLSSDIRKRFFTRKQLISSLGMLLSVFVAQRILQNVAYPSSYIYLFFLAAGFLLVASFGFWSVKERPKQPEHSQSYIGILKSIPSVLKHDPSFARYIIFSNIMSISIALIPFFIGYAKSRFIISESELSYILVVQIMGMIISSLIWPRVVSRGGFKQILRLRVWLSILLPLGAILMGLYGNFSLYLVIVFFIGFSISARTVSEDAVLIELSDDQSRVLYSGIIGTMNVSIIIFPILLGILIAITGSVPIFIGVSIVSISGFYFLKRMVCPVDIKSYNG